MQGGEGGRRALDSPRFPSEAVPVRFMEGEWDQGEEMRGLGRLREDEDDAG